MIKEKNISLYSPKFIEAPAIEKTFWEKIKLNLDFIIISAPKSGTKWIYHCLRQSKEIYLPPEQNFFTSNRDKGEEYYPILYKNITDKKCGEYSNTYMLDNNLAEVFATANPDVKIIICCRNPIYRAYSHFLMDVRRGFIDEKENFINTLIKSITYSYFDFGLYYKHINKYLQYFDSSKMLILSLEQIKKNPLSVAYELFDFVGVKRPAALSTIIEAKNSWESHKFSNYKRRKRGLELSIRFLKKTLSESKYSLLKNSVYGYIRDKKPALSKKMPINFCLTHIIKRRNSTDGIYMQYL